MAKRRQKFTEEIRQAVDASGLSRYRIAKELGIAESTMSRFMNGQGLGFEYLDALAEFVELLIAAGRKKKSKGRLTMRVFRATYKDRKGRTQEAESWYVEFKDHLDRVRRVPGFVSKAASQELGKNLVRLVQYFKASGGQTDPDLMPWLQALPERLRRKLVEIGLIPAHQSESGKPLTEHLDDFEKHLRHTPNKRGDKNTEEHVRLVMARLRRIV